MCSRASLVADPRTVALRGQLSRLVAVVVLAAAWRLLILDRDPSDSKWLLATVIMAADVLSATLDAAGRPMDCAQTAQWVRESVGHDVEFRHVPGAQAWHVQRAQW
jgi:uncharacterized membrane protein